MDAVISGRAGKALLMDGESLMLFDVDNPAEIIPVRPASVNMLLGDSRDLRFLEDTDHNKAAAELEREFNFACALDLALIILDGDLSDEVRLEACSELNELLADTNLIERLENLFYARPLPVVADITRALTLCSQSGATVALDLFQRLEQRQPLIREVCQKWDSIPDETFGGTDERAEFFHAAISEGLFRKFVIAREERREAKFFLDSIMNLAFTNTEIAVVLSKAASQFLRRDLESKARYEDGAKLEGDKTR